MGNPFLGVSGHSGQRKTTFLPFFLLGFQAKVEDLKMTDFDVFGVKMMVLDYAERNGAGPRSLRILV